MKRLFVALVVLGLAVTLAAPAFCAEQEEPGRGEDYGDWMMGPGHGMGYGPHHGWGMHGHGRAWVQKPPGWQSMKPEQREKWEKMRATFLTDTLEVRKQLAAKQMELGTLWAQPKVDRARVEKLSNEVAELRTELLKKRNQYLVRCREEFGDQGWACPGGGWGAGPCMP